MRNFVIALAALLGAPLVLSAADGDLQEKTRDVIENIKEGTQHAVKAAEAGIKEGWAATKEYLSKDPAEYRAGAGKRLDELGAEITELQPKVTAAPADREYVKTRASALDQHLAFAKTQLAALPQAEGPDFDGARASLDRTIGHLESAVSQLRRELGDLS